MKHPSRGPVAFERRSATGPRNTLKPAAWNHQHELKDGVGKLISIRFDVETHETYRLVAADRFTLKVSSADPNSKSALTLFKSALLGYQIKE